MAVFDNGYNGRKVSALQLPLSASAAGLNLSGLSAATGSAVGSGDGIAALKLDLSQLQALGEAPAIGDFLSVLDASVGSGNEMADPHKVATKKMTVAQLGETLANPPSADGDSLGTADLEWSDLYLADGGVIYMGNDQEIRMTHSADAGIELKYAAAGDDKFFTLTLQTGDTDIAVNDKLGAINFQAPDEGTGTDAILVAAGIEAVSEGFAADSNATKLSFKTAASEAASEKMALSSTGVLTLNGGSGALVIPDGGTIGSLDNGRCNHYR